MNDDSAPDVRSRVALDLDDDPLDVEAGAAAADDALDTKALPPLGGDALASIVRAAGLGSRPSVEAAVEVGDPAAVVVLGDDVPELVMSSSGSSSSSSSGAEEESDEDSEAAPATPSKANTTAHLTALSAGRSRDLGLSRCTTIGGATVRNLCLVVPDQSAPGRGGGFADLPVFPIESGSPGSSAQLISTIPGGGPGTAAAAAGDEPQMNLLLFPREKKGSRKGDDGGAAAAAGAAPPRASESIGSGSAAVALASIMSLGQHPRRAGASSQVLQLAAAAAATAAEEQKDVVAVGEEPDGETKEKEKENKTPEVGKEDLDKYVLSGDIDDLFGIKGLGAKIYKYKAPADKKGKDKKKKAEEAGEKGEKKGGEGKGKGDETEPEPEPEPEDGDAEQPPADDEGPAREKVKLNPLSPALLGRALGAIFPSLNEELGAIPVERLEFTYSEEGAEGEGEEKEHWLFEPGLRLEVDVALRGNLEWAGSALRQVFAQQPGVVHDNSSNTVHLSAWLSGSRDWSRRPEVERIDLQGSVRGLRLKPWDVLNFKELGVRIVAEKAAKTAPAEEKSEDEKKEKEKEKKGENKDDAPGEEEGNSKEADSSPSGAGAAAVAAAKEDSEADGDAKDPASDAGADQEEEDSKKDLARFFSFSFFGRLQVTGIPHANVPVDMAFRLGRDFKPKKEEKEKKKGDEEKEKGKDKDKDKKAGGNAGGDSKAKASKEDGKSDSGETKKPEKEDEPQGPVPIKHDRVWSLVVQSEEWKNVCNIENLTMSQAKFKMSFKESDFKKSVKLELSAKLKLGKGKFNVKGSFARGDHSLSAEVGDLKFSEIKRIHAQMAGQEAPRSDKAEQEEEAKDAEKEAKKGDEETAGNELAFKKLRLSLSRKTSKKTTRNALELEGEVAFNEHASADAALTFASDGLTISGGVSDFKIPSSAFTVKKAGLLIFIAFKHDEKKKSEKEKGGKDEGEEGDQGDGEKGGAADDQGDDEPGATDGTEKGDPAGSPDGASDNAVATLSAPPEQKTDRGKTEDAEKTKKTTTKRESKFSVLGVVKVHETTIKVGFYIERKKGATKREWLAFGAVEGVKLRSLWESIPEESFMNLQLSNIALIASSADRKKKEEEGDEDSDDKTVDEKPPKEKDGAKPKDGDGSASKDKGGKDEAVVKTAGKEEKKDDKKKEKKDDKKEEKEEAANWDALVEIEAYEYPIVKGFQICATISSFPQLEKMNEGKSIDGMVLILSISPSGKIKAELNLPKSLRIIFSPEAYLGDLGGAVAFGGEGPELQLKASLTWLCKDSNPLVIEGVVIASLVGMSGMLKMSDDSQWVNPFGLNKNLIVSELGIEAGFKYATVLVQGPDQLTLSGAVELGRFHMGMMLGVKTLSADAVLEFRYPNHLDVMDVVEMAGTLTGLEVLKDLAASGGKGMVVFHDIYLYLSTGAEFLGKYMPRGIKVRGELQLFGKKGEFDGTFDDDGVVIRAGMDNFKLGGLEVSSTRPDEKRAVMDVEMTRDRQRVFIDGMIRFFELEMKVFIDADVQKKYLRADLSLTLTESLGVSLRAEVNAATKSLDTAVVKFEGELDLDVHGLVFEGIKGGIRALEERAAKAIDDLERDLEAQIRGKTAELGRLGAEVQELERQSSEEVLQKKGLIDEEHDKLDQYLEDLRAYEEAYSRAKADALQHGRDVTEQRARRDKARENVENKKRELREGLDAERKRMEKQVEEWEQKKKALEDQKEASWGDQLRDWKTVEKSWAWWTEQEVIAWRWKCDCEWYLDHCWLWEKPYWLAKLAEAAVGLEQIHARKAVDTEIKHAARKIMNDPLFIEIEKGINTALFEIDKFGRALDNLASGKGMWSYLETMSEREHEHERREIAILEALVEKGREFEANIDAAKRELDAMTDRVSPKQRAAWKRAAELEGEIAALPSKARYLAKKRVYEEIEAKMRGLQATLEDIKKGVRLVSGKAQEILDTLKQGIPAVKRILIKATSAGLQADDALVVELHSEWLGKAYVCRVAWSPGQGLDVLFSKASAMLVTGEEDLTEEPGATLPDDEADEDEDDGENGDGKPAGGSETSVYLFGWEYSAAGGKRPMPKCWTVTHGAGVWGPGAGDHDWTAFKIRHSPKANNTPGGRRWAPGMYAFMCRNDGYPRHNLYEDGAGWSWERGVGNPAGAYAGEHKAAVAFRGQVLLLFQGKGGAGDSLFCKQLVRQQWREYPAQWADAVVASKWPMDFEGGLSAAVLGDRLHIVYRRRSGTLAHMVYSGRWDEPRPADTAVRWPVRAGSVSAVAFRGRLFVFYVRAGTERYSYTSLPPDDDGGTWADVRDMVDTEGARGGLTAVARGGGDEQLLLLYYPDGRGNLVQNGRTLCANGRTLAHAGGPKALPGLVAGSQQLVAVSHPPPS